MITRKRWTPAQDAHFMYSYNEFKNEGKDDEYIFNALSQWSEFGDRTIAALKARYYTLTNEKQAKPKQTNEYSDFLLSLELMRTTYEATLLENQQLKKRIAELEENNKEFEVLARVMDKARKLVVNEELGEHEKPRFKMDGNGNLNRI